MDVSELIKKVRRLELKTKKQSNELFSGSYTSTFKGRGISFHGVRQYNYGDDIRTIDWNVTSRSMTPHVKEFEEERELNFIILVDVSHSTQFGSNESRKRDIMNEVAATIAFSALNNSDKVGIIFFSDKVEKYIPPKKGKSHILTILRELVYLEPTRSGTNISEALIFLQNTVKKKSIVFLLSDFIDSVHYDKELKLNSPRHRFYAIQFYDEAEQNFPPIGVVPLWNSESHKMEWVDTNSRTFRDYAQKQLLQNMEESKTKFKRTGGEYCSINIQEPYIHILAEVFKG